MFNVNKVLTYIPKKENEINAGQLYRGYNNIFHSILVHYRRLSFGVMTEMLEINMYITFHLIQLCGVCLAEWQYCTNVKESIPQSLLLKFF